MKSIFFILLFQSLFIVVYAQNSLSELFSEEQVIRANDFEDGTAIHSADINQDGWMDILVGGYRRPNAVLYINNRLGGFNDAILIDPENRFPGPANFLTLDYDGDTDIDIIIGYEWNGIHLYENNGDETFKSGREIHFDEANSLVIEDFDDDGYLEMVSSSGRGSYLRITKLVNPDSISQDWINVGQHYYSGLIDMDNDGDQDVALLLSSLFQEENFYWLENLGDSLNIKPRKKNLGIDYREIDVEDINGDGLQDLVLKKNNGFDVFLHFGDSSFYKMESYNGNEVKELTVGDLNSDGLLDVAFSVKSSGFTDHVIYVWYSDTDQYLLVDKRGTELNGLEIVDINNDGINDIIGVSGINSSAFWYKNNGDRTFSDRNFINKGLFSPSSLSISDLDNNGIKEIIAISGRQSRISFFEMTEQRQWSQKSIDSGSDNSENFALADFDGDGYIDITIPSFSSGEVLWKKNLGNKLFGKSNLVNEISSALFTYTSDFNNDGFEDILTMSRSSFNNTPIRLNINNKLGGFNEPNYLNLYNNDYDAVFIEDINNDSLVDIITISENGPDLQLNLNQGDNSFEGQILPYANIIDISYPSHYVYSDLNGDGEKDIITLHKQGEVSWMELLENGYYFRYIIREAQSGNYLKKNRIRAHDFDLDGDIDLLFGDQSKNQLIFLLNEGEGQFSEDSHLEGRISDNSEFQISDIDSDGDADIIVLDNLSNEISWFENISIQTNNEVEDVNTSRFIQLIGNYPNPFNPTTNFVFELKQAESIEFKIFDITGRLVSIIDQRNYSEGRNEVVFNASSLSSGVYFYKMIGNNFIETSRFTIIK